MEWLWVEAAREKQHFIMKVRPSRTTGIADLANFLPLIDIVPRLDGTLMQMSVTGFKTIRMDN